MHQRNRTTKKYKPRAYFEHDSIVRIKLKKMDHVKNTLPGGVFLTEFN